jgi:predicted nucleotidyltransferase
MRLCESELAAIRASVRAVFGAEARALVFGSRADDRARGGDLDLFVEVAPGHATLEAELALRERLAPALDDLRLDLVLHERGAPPSPIARIAERDGVPV